MVWKVVDQELVLTERLPWNPPDDASRWLPENVADSAFAIWFHSSGKWVNARSMSARYGGNYGPPDFFEAVVVGCGVQVWTEDWSLTIEPTEEPPTQFDPPLRSGTWPAPIINIWMYEEPSTGHIVVSGIAGLSRIALIGNGVDPAGELYYDKYISWTIDPATGGLIRTYEQAAGPWVEHDIFSSATTVEQETDGWRLRSHRFDDIVHEARVALDGWLPYELTRSNDSLTWCSTPTGEWQRIYGDQGYGYMFDPADPESTVYDEIDWDTWNRVTGDGRNITELRAVWDGKDKSLTMLPGTWEQRYASSDEPYIIWSLNSCCMYGEPGGDVIAVMVRYWELSGDNPEEADFQHNVRFILARAEPPSAPLWSGDWGSTGDWVPAYGYPPGVSSFPIAYPELVDGRVVIVNPEDPTDPWTWVTLPPGAPQNGFLSWWLDGDVWRISYDGVMVLAWQVPADKYALWLQLGAAGGFFNTRSKEFQLDPPAGVPPWAPSGFPVDGSGRYRVDTATWEPETGDSLTEHGIRYRGFDVLLFDDRAEVGELFQDRYILTANRAYRFARVTEPFLVDASEAQMIYDAGYGWACYPVPGGE